MVSGRVDDVCVHSDSDVSPEGEEEVDEEGVGEDHVPLDRLEPQRRVDEQLPQ